MNAPPLLPQPSGHPAQPRLVNRSLLMAFLINVGALTSFFLLISVVPKFVSSLGGSPGPAGAVTTAMLAATVVGELSAERATRLVGWRTLLAAGLVLLGAPALLIATSPDIVVIIGLSALRGLGFGWIIVVTGTLVALLVPTTRRAEGLGLSGVVSATPIIVALPLGIWLVPHVGYTPVLIAGAAVAAAGIGPAAKVRLSVPYPSNPVGIASSLRDATVMGPTVVFTVTAMAAGIVVTFLPLALSGAAAGLAAVGLLTQAFAAAVFRGLAGRHASRYGNQRLLNIGVLTCGIGIAILVAGDTPAAVVVGMVIFGSGFGIAQNASLAMMYDRVETDRYPTISALWNIGYDAGYALGALWFGPLAASAGYPTAFAVTATIVITTALATPTITGTK